MFNCKLCLVSKFLSVTTKGHSACLVEPTDTSALSAAYFKSTNNLRGNKW